MQEIGVVVAAAGAVDLGEEEVVLQAIF